jgi:hypothetical protein
MIRYSTTWSVLSAAVLLTLIIAVPAPAQRRTTGATIVLAESVSGCAPAIASWYPGNGRDGYEFSLLPSTTVLREEPRLGAETVVDAAAAEGAPTPREGAE